ncbi:MAG: TetR/AcrR family transcriptional regulator [Gemmatimonadota bacterium]
MGTDRLRRDAHLTRQRLLGAALDLFTSVGYKATTTPEIAERAGIAEATIYRHFSGKEELLNEVYRSTQEWALGIVKGQEAQRAVSPLERLDWIGRRFLDAAVTHPGLMRMLLQQREDRVLDERSLGAAREFREALTQIVAMGKSDGLVRPGPAELWTGVWLAVIAYGVEKVCAREWTPEHPHVGLMLEGARRAIAR